MGARTKYPFINIGRDVSNTGTMHFTVAPHGYTDPVLGVGIYGTPVTETSVLDNIAFTVNMETATNKTDSNTSSMAAFVRIGNTTDTVHNKLQGLLASCSVKGDVFDAYAVQGHTTIDANMATHDANAHITGLSGKVALHANVEQGWVTGVLAIIEGDPDVAVGVKTVTGLCHVIAAQVEATAMDDQVDAILFLGADAAVTCAIKVQGSGTHIPVFLDLADMGNTGFCVADTTEADVAALRYTLAVKCPDGDVGYIGVMRSS
jgi:hypothetical protein